MAGYETSTAECYICHDLVTGHGATKRDADTDRDDKLTEHYNTKHPTASDTEK